MSPTTRAGKDAVRMRGLFGGETEQRCANWVGQIEAEAAAAERERLLERIQWVERERDGATVHWVTREEVRAILAEAETTLSIDRIAERRKGAAAERERLAAVFAVAAVRYGSRLKYPADVWKEVQSHLAATDEGGEAL